MPDTTIKVSTETRDRISALARERSGTANSVIEMLLDSYLRQDRMALAVRQMATTSPEDWQTYLEESAEWDGVASDGLDGW